MSLLDTRTRLPVPIEGHDPGGTPSAHTLPRLGLAAEVLSDASGAIHLANEAGKVSADDLHQTLLVLLHSNFAATATTAAWTAAVEAGEALPKSDLGTSATQGLAAFAG